MKWMKRNRKAILSLTTFPALMLIPFLGFGCGGSGERQNKDFFTSGSAEADQRADQRMAQSQQLKGEAATPASLSLAKIPDRSMIALEARQDWRRSPTTSSPAPWPIRALISSARASRRAA